MFFNSLIIHICICIYNYKVFLWFTLTIYFSNSTQKASISIKKLELVKPCVKKLVVFQLKRHTYAFIWPLAYTHAFTDASCVHTHSCKCVNEPFSSYFNGSNEEEGMGGDTSLGVVLHFRDGAKIHLTKYLLIIQFFSIAYCTELYSLQLSCHSNVFIPFASFSQYTNGWPIA